MKNFYDVTNDGGNCSKELRLIREFEGDREKLEHVKKQEVHEDRKGRYLRWMVGIKILKWLLTNYKKSGESFTRFFDKEWFTASGLQFVVLQ
jgi:hypothetical protein